jgi:hypothetical protein
VQEEAAEAVLRRSRKQRAGGGHIAVAGSQQEARRLESARAAAGKLLWVPYPDPSDRDLLSLFDSEAEEGEDRYFFTQTASWVDEKQLIAGALDVGDVAEPDTLPFDRGACVVHCERWLETSRSLFAVQGYTDPKKEKVAQREVERRMKTSSGSRTSLPRRWRRLWSI